MTTKHTPTPWAVEPETINGKIVSTINGDIHVRTHPLHREHDAAFIVRACNSHDDLLEALEAMVEAFGGGAYSDAPQYRRYVEALESARAAIAKARGL